MMKTFLFGVYQIFKKPGIFFITLMLATSLIVSFYSFLIYDSYRYPVRQIKETISYSVDDVYKINFGLTLLGLHSEDADNVMDLFERLDGMPGLSAWGGYYYSIENGENKLYINDELFGLCGAKDSKDIPLEFDYDEINGDYGIAFVGKEFSEKYPLGSIFYDNETGCQYIVKGYVKDGSKWISDDLYEGAVVNLDNVIILDLGYAVSQHGNEFLIFNACNNLFFVAQDKTIKGNVEEIIKSSELNIDGVFSLETICSSYEKEAMDNAGENYLLPLVLLISAVIVSAVTSKMSFLTSKKDYGIMITNGFTKADIVGIVVMENVIKTLVAYLVCLVYWTVQYINMDFMTKKLYDDMWIFKIMIVIVIIILSCENSVKYLLKVKPIELINKKDL